MLRHLLIGSAALPPPYIRTPGDIDIIIKAEDLNRWTDETGYAVPLNRDHYVVQPFCPYAFNDATFRDYLEFLVDDARLNRRDLHYELWLAYPHSLLDTLLESVYFHGLHTDGVASLDVLYTLKLSHRFKASAHFQKTRQDIKWMRHQGAKVPGVLEDWLRAFEKDTLSYHKHPNLNQNRLGFFRPEEVPYVYVHDTIHLAVARLEGQPAYLDFHADGAEVKVDRVKWERLPEERKLDSVMEESFVLALERHQIPNQFRPSPYTSFKIALEKVCTTIASGWWRTWAWEHYDDAMAAYQAWGWHYVERFERGLKQGIVQRMVNLV